MRVAANDAAHVQLAAGLDEIVRVGARRMLAAALEAEVAAYRGAHAGERDEAGRRLVVRNGHARPRQVTTVAGAVEVSAPRVDDRRVDEASGQAPVPQLDPAAVCRRSPKVTEVLPLLYLHGLSSGNFVPALEEFFGSKAGLSASVITRLTATWQEEQRRFAERDLSGVDYVYLWVDGVHFNVRLDEDRVCALVMVGVRGRRQEGAGRPRRRAPRVHHQLGGPAARLPPAGDARPGARHRRRRAGVLGRAARGVSGDPRTAGLGPQSGQRARLPAEECPARGPQGAGRDRDAEDRARAEAAIDTFVELFGVKYPKAVAKIVDDREQLLAFYDFPAEHWVHLKTMNPIESTFATVRLRTKVTKGPGSRAAGLAMVFKLLEAAQEHWRFNGAHLVALVRAGAKFEKGVLVERPEPAAQEVAA